MKTKHITTLAALVAAPFCVAQTSSYSWETNLDYTTRDTDLEDSKLNEDNIDFGAVYYFTPIDYATGGDAYRELAFTQRASSLDLRLNIRELDDDIDNVVDLDAYTINGLWVNPETGWYANLGYTNANTDISGDFTSGIFRYQPDFDGYSLSVGKYVAENTTVGVVYSAIDYKNRTEDSFVESSSDTIGVAFKHYMSFTDNTGFSLEGNLYFIDLQVAQFDELDDQGLESSGEVYGLKATYYPSRNLGIGISYSDADDLGGRPYLASRTAIRDGAGIFAEWFATERFSLHARYANNEYDLSDADNFDDPGEVESDSLTFGAAYRF
ncbi:hypothetical protein [Pelagicoccus sp. SDUM812005]|uniref:hypothetical protein n=1 Tax=Pelagicoccus sp. SDUM812005 TaxID=3041257 RepID=UPI0028102929|nr:hypothetical protein [Pelagicoccus sp. SDUM812005]MDQ8181054.1 hypothetical protein [Pelagicoccus sp. SDUM812005]